MSGIFDGCNAKEVGLDCNCKYCSAIKSKDSEPFPEGFPEWMKDYRLLKALELQETVTKNSGRLDKTERMAIAAEQAHEVSLPLLDSLDKEVNNHTRPKIGELDGKTKSLETKTKTIEERLQTIENLKLVERLASIESKLPDTPGTTRT